MVKINFHRSFQALETVVSAISAQVQVDVDEHRFSWAAWIESFLLWLSVFSLTRSHISVFRVLRAVGIVRSVVQNHHTRIKWKSVSPFWHATFSVRSLTTFRDAENQFTTIM